MKTAPKAPTGEGRKYPISRGAEPGSTTPGADVPPPSPGSTTRPPTNRPLRRAAKTPDTYGSATLSGPRRSWTDWRSA